MGIIEWMIVVILAPFALVSALLCVYIVILVVASICDFVVNAIIR